MTQQQGDGHSARIVVGVDGSPSAGKALRWAVRQAELTGVAVEAVIAGHLPLTGNPAQGLLERRQAPTCS